MFNLINRRKHFRSNINAAFMTGASEQYFSATSTSISSDFGFFMWIKTTSTQHERLFRYNTGGAAADINDTTTNKFQIVYNGLVRESTSDVNDGLLHLVGYTVGGGTLRLYVDGTEENSGSVSTLAQSGTLTIGTTLQALPPYYDGHLCFPMAFDALLTGSEVTDIYNSGQPMCDTTMSSQATSAYNKLNGLWHCAEWSGMSGTALEDRINSADLTNNNSTPFTLSGISIDC